MGKMVAHIILIFSSTNMPIFINLLLSAIRPITFFLPCAAIILGSGLAAFSGVVDGPLFSGLFLLTIFAQISVNLANDYQRAFITHADAIKNSRSAIQYKVRNQMLKLILSCFFVFLFGLILLSHLSTGGSIHAYILIAICAGLLLTILRVKTRYKKTVESKINKASLLGQFLLLGFIPTTLSYHLHTSTTPSHVILFAICCGILSLASILSEHIAEQVKSNSPVVVGQLPPPLKHALLWQKIILILATVFTALAIFITNIPFLSGIFILALPALFATVVTIEHLPEDDIANSQISKIKIACFAFWVLFIVGMMI